MDAVQYPLKKRGDRDKRQKGKHYPGKKNRFIKGRHAKKRNKEGGKKHTYSNGKAYKKAQKGKHTGNKFLGFFLVPLQEIFFERRDKGNCYGTFREKPAKQVGDHKGHGEGVGKGAGSQKRRLGHFPEQPQYAGGKSKERECSA
jgi:hypothetical protein